MRIAKFIPLSLQWPLKRVRNFVFAIAYRGTGRCCPVCNKSSRKFGKVGSGEDARCMHCGALERHRFCWLYFKRKTDLFDRKPINMLHVAPEHVFGKLLLKHLGSGYLTADLYDPRAMVEMDITDIQYHDESFDVIYCSHVLQYVPDDKQAMREFFRVLKPDGWAVLLVPPITDDGGFEYPLITDPSKLLNTYEPPYDPENPARRYGTDYVEKLKEAGFNVKVIHPSDFLSHEEILHMGITREAGEIYYCTKKRYGEKSN